MTLIKSISGIRGTIGGEKGNNLTPIDVVKFTSAYVTFLKNDTGKSNLKIVVGRDARISGFMVNNLVCGTLIGMGVQVVDLGLSTTPTVEIAVPNEDADGGIILTASHNPKQWNALKLLNNKGEFISGDDGEKLLRIAEEDAIIYNDVDNLGKYEENSEYMDIHIDKIFALELINIEKVKQKKFKVVVDAVNSTGGLFVPRLLERMGVEVVKLYCEPTGHFPHNPEPLPENLGDIIEVIKKENADFGIVVDPDVDRLAMVSENGEVFGEEYTLVAIADYVLSKKQGNTVSNLSSTRALADVTKKHAGEYFASAVGEVNVVEMMKKVNAVIGGEGNGGVIYPELHYGRDALVGIALFLCLLTEKNISCSELRNTYPNYFISKNKIELTPDLNVDEILVAVKEKFKAEKVNDIDGVKVDFENGWVHLRKSNTEPIIRVYSESNSQENADRMAQEMMKTIEELTTIIS